MATTDLSVVIVAYHSLDHLRHSLPPLLNQLRERDEVIVVDNAASGELEAELSAMAPGVRLISAPQNLGFAAGANAGAALARGDLIVLLNPDAVIQPGWADALRAAANGSWAAWMALVTLGDGTAINTRGGRLHFTGFGWAGGVGEPVETAPPQAEEVSFVSGACMALPRATWQQLGGFPEAFFMYCEDVDLSLRVRLSGGHLGVIPQARVIHSYEFMRDVRKWRLLERNRWATVLRTYPASLLALVMPALLVAELVVWTVAIRGGWAGQKARATFELIRWLPRLLRERRAIQAGRVISAQAFAGALTSELSSPYLGRLADSPLLRTALARYWQFVRLVLGRSAG